MTQFNVSIKDSKAAMFLELLKNLAFVTKIEKIEDMDIPAEQKKAVADRIKKSKENPERMLDWENEKDTFNLD